MAFPTPLKELISDEFTQLISKYEELCNKCLVDIKRYVEQTDLDFYKRRENEFIELVNYVNDNTNYLNAAASTKYHLCRKHGLLEHSLNVCNLMLKLNETLNTNIPIHKIIVTGLYHDLGKHNMYVHREPTEKQKAAGFKAFPPYDLAIINEWNTHENRSLYLITQYYHLLEDEMVAIQYHNAPWDGSQEHNYMTFSKAPLLNILQMSDYWATTYIEPRP